MLDVAVPPQHADNMDILHHHLDTSTGALSTGKLQTYPCGWRSGNRCRHISIDRIRPRQPLQTTLHMWVSIQLHAQQVVQEGVMYGSPCPRCRLLAIVITMYWPVNGMTKSCIPPPSFCSSGRTHGQRTGYWGYQPSDRAVGQFAEPF